MEWEELVPNKRWVTDDCYTIVKDSLGKFVVFFKYTLVGKYCDTLDEAKMLCDSHAEWRRSCTG